MREVRISEGRKGQEEPGFMGKTMAYKENIEHYGV